MSSCGGSVSGINNDKNKNKNKNKMNNNYNNSNNMLPVIAYKRIISILLMMFSIELVYFN